MSIEVEVKVGNTVTVTTANSTQVDVTRASETVVTTTGISGPQGPEGATGPAGPAGPTGPQGPQGDGFYVEYPVGVASTTWTINHNLNGYPAITTIDSAGNTVEGSIDYVSANQITVTFAVAFSGTAILT